MQHIDNYPMSRWCESSPSATLGSTLTHRGIGITTIGASRAVDVARLACKGSYWAIEMPMRKLPDERVSSIIVHGRTTQSSLTTSSGWGVSLYLYGIPAWAKDPWPTRQEAWVGPLAVKTLASSPYTLTKKVIPSPSSKSASSIWWCAPSVQFDTQDMRFVAILPMIGSTLNGFAAKSGIKLDIDTQMSTSG